MYSITQYLKSTLDYSLDCQNDESFAYNLPFQESLVQPKIESCDFDEDDDTILNNWQVKPYLEWNTSDLLNWICSEANNNNKDYEELNLDKIKKVPPKDLEKLTKEDFITLTESSEHGEMLFNCKENMIKNTNISIDSESTPKINVPNENCKLNDEKNSKMKSRNRGRGRPMKSNGLRYKRDDSITKGKLWEFLRNLLHNTETCPSLIKWDNFEEGMFKFVQSEKVAKLWGQRKQNNEMNYEKLSRAMRYYYKSQVLLPVHGKRLVYKFGPQATGWKTENPII